LISYILDIYIILMSRSRKGEELVVVISRDSRVSDRKNTYFDENERKKKMVDALGVVDESTSRC